MTLRTPAFNDAKSYGFEWLRAITEADLQEGVLNGGDFKVTPAGAGGMRVDVAAGAAFVKGDSGVAGTGLTQGLYYIVNDALIASAVTFAAADATNPRIDQVVLRARDSSDLGSGADDSVLEIVQGAPTAGATLDNRNGAAALPNDRLRLADVLIPAASVAVIAANVRDRRPWARGAYRRIVRNANAAAGNDYTIATSTLTLMDATNLAPRLEVGANPVRARIVGEGAYSTAPAAFAFLVGVDGAGYDGMTIPGSDGDAVNVAISGGAGINLTRPILPAAGSHVFALYWHWLSPAGTATVYARAGSPFVYELEELVRQNADNT